MAYYLNILIVLMTISPKLIVSFGSFRKEREMQERTGAAASVAPAPTPASQMVQKTESGKYEETRIQVHRHETQQYSFRIPNHISLSFSPRR